ncbi:MAG: hypothetical protein Q8S39_00740 [Ignavibacteria bacterium]|nr:hypothetical protein [Ignavibacteria bacterium]
MDTVKLSSEQKNNLAGRGSKKDKTTAEQEALRKKELIAKANRTEYLLEYVLAKMETLEFENFDSLFPDLMSKMKEAAVTREELIKEVEPSVLIKARPKLFSVAKQIERKYEFLVEKFSAETEQLQRELSAINNKRKITSYMR